MEKLIAAYEYQNGRTILTEKKVEIDKFDKYVAMISNMYIMSLEENSNITEKIRAEFDVLLKSKDKTIMDLQMLLSEQKKHLEEMSAERKRYKESVECLQSKVKDKEEANEVLKAAYTSLKEEFDKTSELRQSYDGLTKEYEEISNEKTLWQ